MLYIIETLNIFDTALGDSQPKKLYRLLKRNDNFGKDWAKAFHGTHLDDDLKNTGLNEVLIRILKRLGIPVYHWGRYLGSSMSFYQFLLEIHEKTNKKHIELQILIDHINHKMGSIWYKLAIACIFCLFIFTILIPFFFQSHVISIISEVVTAVLFIPSLQIIYNTGYALYSFYSSIVDTHIRLSRRLLNNFFEISSAAIKIAAASLVFVVIGSSPIVPILIIVSSALSVIKEAVSFIHLFIERRRKNVEEGESPLTKKFHQARLDNEFRKTRNDLIFNIIAAVLITAIIAVWTFVPGGLPLMIGAIAGMALVYTVKLLFQIYNEKTKKKELLNAFDILESEGNVNAVGDDMSHDDQLTEKMTYSSLHEQLGGSAIELKKLEASPKHYDSIFKASDENANEDIESKGVDATLGMLVTNL